MITNIFLAVLGSSLSVSLIVVVLILFASVLNRRYAAKWKYLVWIFLAVRLLIPVSAANVQSVTDPMAQAKMQTASGAANGRAAVLPDEAAPRRVIATIPARMTMPIAMQSGKNSIRITLFDLAAFVWMLGALIYLTLHLCSYFHYKNRVMKRGAIIRDQQILRRIFELKRELHIGRTIRAVEYPDAVSPMIIGFVNPVLVLPKTRLFMEEESAFVLKHELVHFKRGDVYFKLLFVAANAVHWFNPLVWIMQKEAVIDMELSCDECVVQGADYAVRKAYTETLLSMLHKRCTKRTVLSTQFYGGKTIMKKRFKNILVKKRKKNGIFVLIGAVALTIGLGTLVGCSITTTDVGNIAVRAGKEDADDVSDPFSREEAGNISEQPGTETMASDHFADDSDTLENTIMLTFFKEGEEELRSASLEIGDGYSLYLPDDEWLRYDSDTWTTAVNEQVRLWVAHFKDAAIREKEKELADDGYESVDRGMRKQDGVMVYQVRLYETENDVWGVYSCYPLEAEEGWGRELPVIVDTFAVSTAVQQEN